MTRRTTRPRDESGSLILDLLIGMAIFALVAAIVVGGVGAYRVRAYEQGALADAHSIAQAAEADSDKGYPASLDASTLAGLGLNLSPGNQVGGYDVDGDSFALCVEHSTGTSDAYAIYDSAQGGIIDKGRNGGCVGKVLDAGSTPYTPPAPTGTPTPPAFVVPGPSGKVIAWGYNPTGGTNVPAAALSNVSSVASGMNYSLALKSDGTVIGWGENANGQATPPAGLGHVVAIGAGVTLSVALKDDGSVVAWGQNIYGQTTVPAAAQSGVTQISVGSYHTLALKSDGSVVAWGFNGNGESTVPVAAQSGVVQVAAGDTFNAVLKSDGSVVAWGKSFASQTTVPVAAQSGVVAISVGWDHTLALKSNGTVVGWGNTANTKLPIPGGLTGVTKVLAGRNNSMVQKSDGSLQIWGLTTNGQTSIPAAAASGVFRLGTAGSANHFLVLTP